MKISHQLQTSLPLQNDHHLQYAGPTLLFSHNKPEQMVELFTFYLSVLKQKLTDLLGYLIFLKLILWNYML